jgi:hypothetical protein
MQSKAKKIKPDEAARVKEIQAEAAEMARGLRAMMARSRALAKELDRMPSSKAVIAADKSGSVRQASLAYELAGDLLTWQDCSAEDWLAALTKAAKRTKATAGGESEEGRAGAVEPSRGPSPAEVVRALGPLLAQQATVTRQLVEEVATLKGYRL